MEVTADTGNPQKSYLEKIDGGAQLFLLKNRYGLLSKIDSPKKSQLTGLGQGLRYKTEAFCQELGQAHRKLVRNNWSLGLGKAQMNYKYQTMGFGQGQYKLKEKKKKAHRHKQWEWAPSKRKFPWAWIEFRKGRRGIKR